MESRFKILNGIEKKSLWTYEFKADYLCFSQEIPKTKPRIRVNSSRFRDLLTSYFVRKHDGMHQVDAKRHIEEIEEVLCWRRVAFQDGKDDIAATVFAPENNQRPSCYIATEMDTSESAADVYYGKLLQLHSITFKTPAYPLKSEYKVMLVSWASGISVGSQHQLYKNCRRDDAFTALSIEDVSTLRRLIGVVEHSIPSGRSESNRSYRIRQAGIQRSLSRNSGSVHARTRKRTYFLDERVTSRQFARSQGILV